MAATVLTEKQRGEVRRLVKAGLPNHRVLGLAESYYGLPPVSKSAISYYIRERTQAREEPPASPPALAARAKPTATVAVAQGSHADPAPPAPPPPDPTPAPAPARRTVTVEWKPRPDRVPVPSYLRGRGARSCGEVVAGNPGSQLITAVGESLLGYARSLRGGNSRG